jgi:hypothetical protein
VVLAGLGTEAQLLPQCMSYGLCGWPDPGLHGHLPSIGTLEAGQLPHFSSDSMALSAVACTSCVLMEDEK